MAKQALVRTVVAARRLVRVLRSVPRGYPKFAAMTARALGLARKLLRCKGDVAAREAVFAELKCELASHAAAEERFLYAVILMDDMGLAASRHALAEHHELEEIVAQMSVTSKSGAAWMAQARKLSEEIHHHLKEEERGFFQVAGKILSASQKKTLAGKYARELARMRKVEEEA